MNVIDIDEVNKALAPKPKAEITVETDFTPIPAYRRVKHEFFRRCGNIDRNKITAAMIISVVPDNRVEIWWRIPGFKQWFISEESVASRLTELMHLRLDVITEVLTDDTGIYSTKDKIIAGAELDKIAKTVTDAQEAVEGKKKEKAITDIDAKIKEEYERLKTTIKHAPTKPVLPGIE